MRFRAKVDANQREIVAELRERGYGVISLAPLGKGIPDLCVSLPGTPLCVLLELKTKRGKLTDDQNDWHREWTGKVYVVRSHIEALAALQSAGGKHGF